MPHVRILSVRTIADPKTDRAGQPATWIMYEPEDGGPARSCFLAGANPSPDAIDACIRAHAKATATLEGRRLEL